MGQICWIWNGTQDELNIFHNQINKINNDIKFTLDIEKENKINFLDLTLIKNRNKIEFNIFRKPTNTDLIIPYQSNHDISQKLSAFQSLYFTAYNLPLNSNGLKKELKIIEYLAIKNNYPLKMIEKILTKHKNNIYIYIH